MVRSNHIFTADELIESLLKVLELLLLFFFIFETEYMIMARIIKNEPPSPPKTIAFDELESLF